jgi:hypothetical protein
MEAMDSDDEMMFAALMEEEAVVAAAADKHLMMLSCLLVVYARDAQPRSGGSAPGRHKSKLGQWMEGYCIQYADYFADDSLHGV